MILNFLLNPLVSRVNRRIPIRIVRFWRSTKEVVTWFGSGLPITFSCRSRCTWQACSALLWLARERRKSSEVGGNHSHPKSAPHLLPGMPCARPSSLNATPMIRLAQSSMKSRAHPPRAHQPNNSRQSFVSASNAVHVQTHPILLPFALCEFFALAPTKAPNLIALQPANPDIADLPIVELSAAVPTSTRSLVTVLIETSAMRLVARRLFPSTSIPMIFARSSQWPGGSCFKNRTSSPICQA